MTRMTKAVAHLSAEEVKNRMKTDVRPWCRQRWFIIYHALVDPQPAAEIARHCGVSKLMVHRVISVYNRLGCSAVETVGKGGRHHQYMTVEQERQFLSPFFARAESGAIATATEIKQAFEMYVGHEVNKSTMYRLLKRHGGRKLVPRPVHPQSKRQEQEQFKKTLRRWLKQQMQLA